MSDWRRTPPARWAAALSAAAVPEPLATGLVEYLALLARWDAAINLVGEAEENALLRHHVLESLAGVEHLPLHGLLLDLGTGNGFPAVPLLLANRGVQGVLLEPRERRWAFLREAVRELGLSAEVRRERAAAHRGSGYDVVSVRALALREWEDVIAGLLAGDGRLLWWRGLGEEAARPARLLPVLTSALPDPRRGTLAVWRRCST